MMNQDVKLNDNAHPSTVREDESHTLAGQLTHRSQLNDVFDMFPQDDNIVYAFAYGSGVFDQQLVPSNPSGKDDASDNLQPNDQQLREHSPQTGDSKLPTDSPQPMLDLILVVEDAKSFHRANAAKNRHHYSTSCRILGPTGCSHLQRHYGAGVFFVNTTIPDTTNNHPHQKRRLKYGIIQDVDLQADLIDWNYLYIAGRMQKPTLPILLRQSSQSNALMPPHLWDAQQTNLQSALVTACCLLVSNHANEQKGSVDSSSPSLTIPWPMLFEQICALSYAGDFRMAIGAEDPRKIQRLVHGPGQLQRFQTLYERPLQTLHGQGLMHTSPSGLELPLEILTSRRPYRKHVPEPFWNLVPNQLQQQAEKQSSLSRALQAIVAPAARGQAVKGLVTAGLGASIRYAAAKFAKGWMR